MELMSRNDLFVYKYQPLLLNDFELDNDLRALLYMMVEKNQLNLLFVGESGTGKSSLLQALIREYYCFENMENEKRLMDENVLCINNLKEQGIQYYRNDVKIFCQTCSTINGRKKMVILDDIDFISEPSQQVFRHFMDEFSGNVHFLASTSNIHKVIESLQSRFMILQCCPLSEENLSGILRRIQEKEKILMTMEAETFVLSLCNGSAKNLMNYMEKFKLLDMEIDASIVDRVCTDIGFSLLTHITLNQLKVGDLEGAIRSFYDLWDKGYSVMDILDTYFLWVKTTKELTEDEKYKMIPILCKYIDVFYNIHEDEIELALLVNDLVSTFNPVEG